VVPVAQLCVEAGLSACRPGWREGMSAGAGWSPEQSR
jgi:hypothetical protein